MMKLAVLSPGNDEYQELDNRLVAFNRYHSAGCALLDTYDFHARAFY